MTVGDVLAGLAPPATSFASDNTAGVDPAVFAALAAANTPKALAYGADDLSAEGVAAFRELLGIPAEVLWCWGGTGANVVGLATMLAPWQAIICADTAHIVVDECGAPARFGGSSIIPVATPDGKLVPASIERYVHWQGSAHHPQPGAISISQVTEMGTVYSRDELAALAETAHAHSMLVHLDGARIANAVASTGCDLASLVVETGVDVMTFGMTKNGAMYGDVVLFLRPELARAAKFVHKQAAQLPSKTRFVAAQALALLDGDRWIENGRHANAMAQRLANAVGAIGDVRLDGSPQANAVFARLATPAWEALQEWSFFWPWDRATDHVRWMTSFATTREDVDVFAAAVMAAVAA